MVVAGVRMMRRPPAVYRVPIDAVVVECSMMTRPRKVTFDYPAPDGTWLRATRFSALPQVQARQGWFVRAGDPIRAYVNPANPLDVNLGAMGTAGGFFAYFLIVAGAFAFLAGVNGALRFLIRGW